MTTSIVDDLDDFNVLSKDTGWSIEPNISYSFTRYVNGGIKFIYGINENRTTGRSEIRDLSFSMNIKIQG